MEVYKHKVFAYITHGDGLLILRHPDAPEAGLQVPAGTMEAGERPEDAVMREAGEETGLTELTLVRFLGTQIRDMADYRREEIHHRHFFHLRHEGASVASWRHRELGHSEGGELPIFELFWARLPDDVPALIADHAIKLPALLRSMAEAGAIARVSRRLYTEGGRDDAGTGTSSAR